MRARRRTGSVVRRALARAIAVLAVALLALVHVAVAASPALADGPDVDNDTYTLDVDCDDANPAVNPGATEIAGDGVDQDCDGNELWFHDSDEDGYRTNTTFAGPLNRPADAGVSTDPLDCDDTNP